MKPRLTAELDWLDSHDRELQRARMIERRRMRQMYVVAVPETPRWDLMPKEGDRPVKRMTPKMGGKKEESFLFRFLQMVRK